jgi:hypothetical protein
MNLVITPLALAALLVGCGSGADSTTKVSQPEPGASSPPETARSPEAVKASVLDCLKDKGISTTKPNGVVSTRLGAVEAEFPKGPVIFLFTGSSAEADRAVAAENALAKSYGIDASDLIVKAGNVVYFWDGTFRHDEVFITNCVGP